MRVVLPLIVVEGPDDAFARAVAEATLAGWRVRDGFDAAVSGHTPVVCAGVVASAEHASRAMLAVLGGAGVVVHAQASREIIDRLLDDLRHVGPVELRRQLQANPPALDSDALEILRLLGEGARLGDAAAKLGLSRRTADRRLAGARRAMGAQRTVEAVAKARRLGLLR